MKYRYIKTPLTISFNEIKSKKFSLSSSQYEQLILKNENVKPVRDFLSRTFKNSDKGKEVGSINYINTSKHFFMRTKALQEYSFIPEFDKESLIPIRPQVFFDNQLKKGDIIISKDSNIGEVVILDQDYPNIMLSNALYKMPIIPKYHYYLFAFLKSDFFREQLDIKVPKGSTIRHAKTLFLDCLIPLPKQNKEKYLSKINWIVQSIMRKEKLIKEKFDKTLFFIEEELSKEKNFITNIFSTSLPKFKEISLIARLDTGMYSKQFKKIIYNIENYTYGSKTIDELEFNLNRGQNLQVSSIGKSITSNISHQGFYKLILPKYLSKYGTVNKVSYLGNKENLKVLKKGDLIFGAEGFEKGRSFIVLSDTEKTITNIHGITLTQMKNNSNNNNIEKCIFVKQFLDYFRYKGIIDLLAAGGNGGSLAQTYWKYLKFPNFKDETIKHLANFYYCKNLNYSYNFTDLKELLIEDSDFEKKAGIANLAEAIQILKIELQNILDEIINF